MYQFKALNNGKATCSSAEPPHDFFAITGSQGACLLLPH
jgi:hypothetical protein